MTSQPIPQQREMEPEHQSRSERMRLLDSPATPRWQVFSFASLARTAAMACRSTQRGARWTHICLGLRLRRGHHPRYDPQFKIKRYVSVRFLFTKTSVNERYWAVTTVADHAMMYSAI